MKVNHGMVIFPIVFLAVLSCCNSVRGDVISRSTINDQLSQSIPSGFQNQEVDLLLVKGFMLSSYLDILTVLSIKSSETYRLKNLLEEMVVSITALDAIGIDSAIANYNFILRYEIHDAIDSIVAESVDVDPAKLSELQSELFHVSSQLTQDTHEDIEKEIIRFVSFVRAAFYCVVIGEYVLWNANGVAWRMQYSVLNQQHAILVSLNDKFRRIFLDEMNEQRNLRNIVRKSDVMFQCYSDALLERLKLIELEIALYTDGQCNYDDEVRQYKKRLSRVLMNSHLNASRIYGADILVDHLDVWDRFIIHSDSVNLALALLLTECSLVVFDNYPEVGWVDLNKDTIAIASGRICFCAP